MPRSRAGSRTPRYRAGYGRISDNKISMLKTHTTKQVAILELDPNEYDEENDIELSSEPGTSYLVVIPIPGRARPLIWNLSSMTQQELEATRQFFNHAFDLADPVVRERDKVAHDAFASGDDSYSRVYRDVPQFIVRTRKKRQHDQGVHDGPEGSSQGAGNGLDPDGRVQVHGDELADSEPQEGFSEDDQP